MNNTTTKNTMVWTALALVGFAFTGCSQQEVALANTLANSAASAGSSFNTNSMLGSTATQKGMVQSQAIGAQMLANPAVLGVGAVSGAISQHNMEQNRKSFGKVTDMYVNSNKMTTNMENMMLKSYNQQHGTHFRSMDELQDSAKVSGYNKQEGTKFSTFTQMREDYNKKKGTNFKTDKEFRDWIAENR